MDKKTKGKVIVGVLVMIALVAAIFILNPNLRPFATSDTSCTGAISADILKIERSPGASTFKIIATANNAGDCLKIAWTQEDINEYLQQSSPDEIAGKGVYGDIILNSQSETFFTSDDNRKVTSYLLHDHGWTTGSCSVSNCKTWGYPTTAYTIRTWIWPGPCACVYTRDVGNFAPFSGAKSRGGSATLKITGLNDVPFTYGTSCDASGKCTVSGGSVNANKVSIAWRGDLLGPRFIGTPGSPYQPFNENGNLKLTTADYEDVISTELDVYANGKWWTNLEECLGKSDGWRLSGTEKAKACIEDYNKKQALALSDKKTQWLDGMRSTVKSALFQGTDFVLEVNPYSTEFPQFEMIVNAAWVGVRYVLGRPQLTCPSAQTFTSGTTKNFDFTIANIDTTESGNFNIGLSCTGSMSVGVTNPRVNIPAGQSQKATGYITEDTTSRQTQTCTLRAETVRPSDRTSSCTFQVTVEPSDKCTPGNKKCSDDFSKLGTCNNLGTDYDWTPCQYGCEYSGTGAKCRGSDCVTEGKACVANGDCCEGTLCKNNVCTKDFNKCSSCFSWLGSKTGITEKCQTQAIIEKHWYNPVTWILPAGGITQDSICPIVIGFYALLAVALGAVAYMIIKIARGTGGRKRRR